MSNGQIRKVVIAGGGTAGWAAAALLAQQFADLLDITLVESEQIGTIGVGESTVPPLRTFHHLIGIDEREFMRATAATFKLSISFENWLRPGDRFFHPFGITGRSTLTCPFHHFWLDSLRRGMPSELGDFSLESIASHGDRFSLHTQPQASYAYHFDASLYARFLRRRAEAHGLRRIEGRIAQVRQNAHDGSVQALVLDDGQVIEGDLFIDCTGFRGLLIEQTLGTGYEDWHQWLPCDRAVAMPCRTETALTPYTSATAMDSGWRWRIPLQHRTGNGYVYSSEFISDEDARAAIVAAVEGESIADPRVLKFKAGRRARSWVRNCVAVGLASGFLEPLESTSIYLIQAAIGALVELFPERAISPVDRDEFNRLIDLEYDRIRDFLILHYHATERSDTPFWDYVRTMQVPDTLQEKIDLFRRRGRIVKYREGVFLDASWIAVYTGQRIVPEGHDRRADLPSIDALVRGAEALRQEIHTKAEHMPDHRAHIERYCPMAEAA